MRLLLVWLLFLAALVVLSIAMQGCTMTRGDTSVSVMQLPPGDDVQSRTTTLVGMEVSPLGIDGPQVRLGYIRTQQSRIPGYEEGTKTPSVKMTTRVDDEGIIVEELEVSDEQGVKGWFSR